MAGAKKSSYWKWLIGASAVLLIIYAVASTYLWARQAHYIFRPQRAVSTTPSDYQLPFEDVYLSVDDGNSKTERIHAWWIPTEYPERRYLLYLHGSALNIAANITHARRFQRMGFSVFLISYRGYGKSDGMFPSEGTVYSDARAAWRYLTGHKKIDPASIFIYGHSLGGAWPSNWPWINPPLPGSSSKRHLRPLRTWRGRYPDTDSFRLISSSISDLTRSTRLAVCRCRCFTCTERPTGWFRR